MGVTEDEVESLRTRLRELEVETAGRRPIESIVKLFIYFLVALSVVVGVFGIKQLSDLDAVVARQVKQEFPRASAEYREYGELIEKTEDLEKKFAELFGKYQSALGNYEHLGKVTADFDLEGRLELLAEQGAARQDREPDGEDDTGTLYEEKWRLGAISTLEVLQQQLKERQFDADVVFNAAQLCDRLKHVDLGSRLVETAYKLNPSDEPIKAAMLSTRVQLADEESAGQAFSELMAMVSKISRNSPHIVLSEAWNAANNLRRYEPLIEKLNELTSSAGASRFRPSFAYALLARAYLSASRPGDLGRAEDALSGAKQKLLEESVLANWHDATVEQVRGVEAAIVATAFVHSQLVESGPGVE